LRVVRKAVAYITREERVLFFRAREAPGLGAELPGGTLLAGEDPIAGVLREAREETGLTELGAPRLLGVVNHDPRDWKGGQVHERHFFEVPLLVHPPDTWERGVEEGNGVFTFSFFWVGSSTIPDKVYPGHDVFLEGVLSRNRNPPART
jgi:ADP-ribose pyrophosphatase YjhB (NUDIX family)